MTIADATPQRIRSIDEAVVDLAVELQHLRPTDPRRLKLAAMITVLEDRIASQPADYGSRPDSPILTHRPSGAALRIADLSCPPSSVNFQESADTWLFWRGYKALATALRALLRPDPIKP